jgi:hypothetical protein
LFNIVLASIAKAIRQEEVIKMIHIVKEEVKVFLLTDDIIQKIPPKKLVDLINTFDNVTGYKEHTKTSSSFIHQQ